MKKILIIILLSLSLCGCKSNVSKEEKLQEIIAEGNYVVVDVRTPEEYAESHVESALNIPYDEINEDTNFDKDKVILVYCQSGNRSKTAYNILTKLGYEVYDLGAFANVELPKE